MIKSLVSVCCLMDVKGLIANAVLSCVSLQWKQVTTVSTMKDKERVCDLLFQLCEWTHALRIFGLDRDFAFHGVSLDDIGT